MSMRSMQVQVFLSCSMDQNDSDVVAFFSSICRGIDMNCVNVDKGCTITPPEKARDLINGSHALIAVATRREQIKDGVFLMPKAVDEEMSMAYATKKPILLFSEKGIEASGFIRNYGTFLEFERESLWSPEFLAKAIASIHEIKMEVISPLDLQIAQEGQRHIFAEFLRQQIELIDHCGSYTWRYSQTRRLNFTSRFIDPIKHSIWATVPPKTIKQSDINWTYSIEDGSKQFKFNPTMYKPNDAVIHVSFDIDPIPESGDVIQYSISFESPYLNPIYLEDVPEKCIPAIINSKNYSCFDGIVSIVRTENLKLHFRFPSSLGLRPEDFVPFAASYGQKIDYIVDSETKRMKVTTDSFGGDVFIELVLENPLLHLMYGVAWNPPDREKKR